LEALTEISWDAGFIPTKPKCYVRDRDAAHMEYHCVHDTIGVGDKSCDMEAEIMLGVWVGSDTHGPEGIFDVGIPKERILGLGRVPIDAKWFQSMYLE
jgi:hypothetical protein